MIGRWWILGVFVAVGLPRVGAHQELYHNIDVDLVETAETGVIRISITIHAPELLVGSSEAANAMFDSRWLRGRTAEELKHIVDLARVFLTEQFEVRFDGRDPVDLGEEVAFEDFESMRATLGRELPPACILATLKLAVPQGARELQVENAADSKKRLMLVVYRPKAFPAVTDVEPGSSAAVRLPNGPDMPNEPEVRTERWGGIYAAAVLAGVAVIGVLLARWGVGRARRREGSRAG